MGKGPPDEAKLGHRAGLGENRSRCGCDGQVLRLFEGCGVLHGSPPSGIGTHPDASDFVHAAHHQAHHPHAVKVRVRQRPNARTMILVAVSGRSCRTAETNAPAIGVSEHAGR